MEAVDPTLAPIYDINYYRRRRRRAQYPWKLWGAEILLGVIFGVLLVGSVWVGLLASHQI